MAAACKTVLSCDLGIRNLALCKFGVSGGRVVTVHHASVHDIVAEGGCSARNSSDFQGKKHWQVARGAGGYF